jgi:protein involved in polysaccharide export with SLBB domain
MMFRRKVIPPVSTSITRTLKIVLATTALTLLPGSVAFGQVSQQQILQQQQQQQQQQGVPQGSPLDPSGRPMAGSSGSSGSSGQSSEQNGLLQPSTVVDTQQSTIPTDRLLDGRSGQLNTRLKPPPGPSEFEKYVERVLGRKLPRFGTDLLLPSQRDFATPATAAVPPDYVLNVGDVVAISMTGSIEGSVEREIDNDGKIVLPKVGRVQLAGTRYADLRDNVSRAIGRQYRGYEVTVGVRRLRGVRVYVTGFANNPGAFTVSSLSTIANAVFAAGGPNAGGSFRTVKLYRNGAEVADFDLYQLVRGGNRVNDAVLQNEDVLFIPPAGQQVAVIGSVQEEAIYEAKPGETLETMLAVAGGPNDLGDASRTILYRTTEPTRVGPQEIRREQMANTEVAGGDILQVLSRGSLIQPVVRQSVLVRVEGEVNRPGNYFVAPNTPMRTVMALAGGLTPRAFAYGTKLTRQSVRIQQQESFREAIEQLELTLAAAPLTADSSVPGADRAAQLAGARATLDRLRAAEPDGRVVMQISPATNVLPEQVLLENNDSIVVPVRSTTVGVFGAVYRPASFLLDDRAKPMRVKDYIDRAGGPIRAADRGTIFVVRANGEVLPRRRGALNAAVLPGDVIFVPVKTQGSSLLAKIRDISSIVFQFGLSAATVAAIK